MPERRFGGVLLECVSNLLANEMFSPEGAGADAAHAVTEGVLALRGHCGTLVVVTNEIFSDGNRYPEETERYIEALAEVNWELAARANEGYESVCGILCKIKG